MNFAVSECLTLSNASLSLRGLFVDAGISIFLCSDGVGWILTLRDGQGREH